MCVQAVGEAIRKEVQQGRAAVLARVIDVKGFSTLPGDGLVAINETGDLYGDILGRPGAARLQAAAANMIGQTTPGLDSVTIAIHGKEVAEVGLSCGGQAEVLLQPVDSIPVVLWDLLSSRAPVALVTRIQGAQAGPASMVVAGDGTYWGSVDSADEGLRDQAQALLSAGRSTTRRIEDAAGVVLVEAWVPAPRLVVVGSGDLVVAIGAQAGLLGWDTESTVSAGELDGLLDWAGTAAALIVLSHDPHVDTPALTAGLDRGVPYVGALGSRATQSRRLERLRAGGVDDATLDRIHSPIGLDLGGRRAPEVALSIMAEILAAHCGRDARPLRDTTGPINDRPLAVPTA
jgi:xanthine dehydrogenase accessory factor